MIELNSPEALHDLRVFLQRSESVSDGVVRLRCSQGALRATVCTFAPLGILDTAPTVLGMRIFPALEQEQFDLLLSGRAMLDRFAHLNAEATAIGVPPTRETAAWAGQDAPQDDWQRVSDIDTAVLNGVALAGIAEVAQALPDHPGEILVREVREHVWNRNLDGCDIVTGAAALTGHILGFFGRDPVASVYQAERWTRVTTSVGHVLMFRRG